MFGFAAGLTLGALIYPLGLVLGRALFHRAVLDNEPHHTKE